MAYPNVPIWLELARLGRDFALSGASALRPHPEFARLERFCFFVGAPRNGHSLVGAWLDAHPQALIAHELGAPRYLAARFSRRQVLALLASNARRAAANGRPHIHYSHAVPGQWQGRSRDLRVMGDKHGEGFLLSVRARPWLTRATVERFDPACFIHVVRNPYDAIASIAGSTKRGQSPEQAAAYFEALYETLESVQDQLNPDRLHLLRFESLLADPREALGSACGFLGLDAAPDYLEACAAIALPRPEDHRGLVSWPEPVRRRVDAMIHRHDFLRGYRFDD